MIDIKTTKFLELKKEYWAQLVGYTVLAEMANKADKKFPKIQQFGIYFSRHALLWIFDVEKIYRNPSYPRFRSWFEKEAKLRFGKIPYK